MDVAFTTIAALGATRTAELLNQAFADYLVKIPFNEAALQRAERLDDVGPGISPVVLLGGEAVGAALVAHRRDESRVAGMAFLPSARRRGLGRSIMEHLLAAARARGDRRMLLEVIGQNGVALRLYEAVGFTRLRRLVGFTGRSPAGAREDSALAEVAVGEVAAALERVAAMDWPWQLSASTVARLSAPAVAYTLEGAWTVVLEAPGPLGIFRALVVEGPDRRPERTARLLRAVMARHAGVAEWRMSALLPEECGGGFAAVGLTPTELYQWQMQHPLA